MLIRQIGLIDQTGTIDPTIMASVAAAISVQVTRDLSQFWPVSATVQALPANGGVPPGCIPAYIVSNLPAGESGVHQSNNNQPYIQVEAGPGWMLAASHEICEMLVDPSMNHLQAATAISVDADGNVSNTDGQFEYLVEVCDPSADQSHAYFINGYTMADFYTPHYFDPVAAGSSVRYSFNGGITAPRQVLKGGYLSWHDPVKLVWQMLDYVNNDPPLIIGLPDMTTAGALREKVDRYHRTTRRLSATPPSHDLLKRALRRQDELKMAAESNARMYQELS